MGHEAASCKDLHQVIYQVLLARKLMGKICSRCINKHPAQTCIHTYKSSHTHTHILLPRSSRTMLPLHLSGITMLPLHLSGITLQSSQLSMKAAPKQVNKKYETLPLSVPTYTCSFVLHFDWSCAMKPCYSGSLLYSGSLSYSGALSDWK